MNGQFYILSLKHSPLQGLALWWGPDSAGYTTTLEEAGKYSEGEIAVNHDLNDGEDTLAIECEKVDGLTRKVVDFHKVHKAEPAERAA